jgi:nucleoid-associated protein YgaU
MARYLNNIYINRLDSGKSYYSTAIPVDPTVEQIQYTYKARVGDRWDTIAHKYLGSATLWYVVANANNALNGSIFIKPGTVITIPESI